MLVEEVPKKSGGSATTIYFTSSINLAARPTRTLDDSGEPQQKQKKAKVNYNLNDLMNAQIQVNDSERTSGPLKSSEQLTLERLATKRLQDLNKESSQTGFELPKSFDNKTLRQGNTPSTKKILSARRNLNSYFEEERNLVSINSILTLNYQYLDQYDVFGSRKKRANKLFRPRIRVCCICSNLSDYARCNTCGLFYCSIRCNKVHLEARCN